jgi:nitrogen fixation/metabolism regulation signal transduction histidine kinase
MSTTTATVVAVVEFALIVAIWYGSLKASHRIAGPVFVFAREVSKLGTGDLNAAIALRDSDMFQAEAQQMNASFAALRSRLAAVQALSAELQSAQAAGADTGPLLEKLAAELAQFSCDGEQ